MRRSVAVITPKFESGFTICYTEPLLPPIRGVVMGKGVVMGVRGVITTPLEAFNPLERVYGG